MAAWLGMRWSWRCNHTNMSGRSTEQAVDHFPEPAVAAVLVVARMPVLFYSETLYRKWAIVYLEVMHVGKGVADMPWQSGDQVGAADDHPQPQKPW
ncbi:hypothetical protein D3C79_1017720 [compost metagenome]